MKLLFWIAKNKTTSKGQCPIYLRITINGKRAEISTNIFIPPDQFDNRKYLVKGQSNQTNLYNAKLNGIKYRLNRIYFDLERRNIEPTAKLMKQLYLNDKKPIIYFIELLKEYGNEIYTINRANYILRRHNRFIDIVANFLARQKLGNTEITEVDYYFLDRLSRALKNDEKYSVSYVKKITYFIASAYKYAYNKRYVEKNAVYNFKVTFRETKNITYLDESKLKTLEKTVFNERLQKVADCFIVQCYTGLSYIDLSRLSEARFYTDSTGLVWFDQNRQKTSGTATIPVTKKVLDILKKYKFNLPVISNQKYNQYLKEISGIIGFKQPLTTHVARKTYGTLLLNKDVPIETVSRLLGHSSVKTTERYYAKVLHMKIARDVRKII